jgi:hypothetical protein
LLSPPGFVAPRIVAVSHPRSSEIPSAEGGYRCGAGAGKPPGGVINEQGGIGLRMDIEAGRI